MMDGSLNNPLISFEMHLHLNATIGCQLVVDSDCPLVRLSQEFRMSLWSRKADIAPRKPPRLLPGQTNPEENLVSPESSLASATSSSGLSSMLVSPQQMTTSPSASSTSSSGNNSSIVSGGQSSHARRANSLTESLFTDISASSSGGTHTASCSSSDEQVQVRQLLQY